LRVAVTVVATAVAVLLGLTYFLGLGGVAVFAIGVAALVWRPLSGLEKRNRAREAALQEELRNATSESDTEFRLH
jgi:hypothetical protein